jgi:5-methylcytosine-specific restriction protein A
MAARPPRLTRTAAPRHKKGSAWEGGSTRKWRKARAGQLDDEPLCADCAAIGRVTAATHVHHPHELAKGGDRFDSENMASLCESHHQQRHGARPKGADARGFPTSPDHPWNR